MSRPNLAARPTRDVAGVVADMMGNAAEPANFPRADGQPSENLKTEKPKSVNTVAQSREKTSFALRPDVKRHLTVLKLDLREAGHRATEAEIVETLIVHADVGTLASLLKTSRK